MRTSRLLLLICLALVFSVLGQQDLVSLADSSAVPTKFDGFKLGMSKADVRAILSKASAKIIPDKDTDLVSAKSQYHSLPAKFEFVFSKTDVLFVVRCSFAGSAKSQFDKVASYIEADLGTSIGERVDKVNESFGLNVPQVDKDRKWGKIRWTYSIQDEQKVSFLPIVETSLHWSALNNKPLLLFELRMEPLQNYPSSEYSDPDFNSAAPSDE